MFKNEAIDTKTKPNLTASPVAFSSNAGTHSKFLAEAPVVAKQDSSVHLTMNPGMQEAADWNPQQS